MPRFTGPASALRDAAARERGWLIGSPAMACAGCGTTMEETGQYCPACGKALAGATADGSGARGVQGMTTAATERMATAAQSSASLTGRTIDGFAIEGVIGTGSFGTVYRARQLGIDRLVAFKVPSYEIAADPVQARRFAREARATARIVHPGVVAIYAVGELGDGRPYLAMQLIDGEPLDRVLAGGPVSPVRALYIARNIASALSETHAAGVVHRDLKPSNVMWRRDRNGDDRITLVDFGIAVGRPGEADATRLTTAGLIGTPHYMSPEQAHGEHVDGRSDLYALGCLLFELVTHTTPFEGSGVEVLLGHLGRPAPRASDRNATVPEIVDRLIALLMEKKPDDRPASADAAVALIDDAIAVLNRAASGTRRAASAPPSASARRKPQPAAALTSSPQREPPPAAEAAASAVNLVTPRPRRRRWIALAAGVLAVAGGLTAFQLRGAGSASEESEPTFTASGALVTRSGEPLRQISSDDGELIIRTTVPATIHAGSAIRAHLAITTKLGGEFTAREVIVTVEDPAHHASALAAERHSDGHYALSHTFAAPGHYVVRIFPSDAETVATLELDVVP